MAMRMLRQKKEQRRNAKLNEIFDERDPYETGKLSVEQIADVFKLYQLIPDIDAIKNIADKEGNVHKEEFIKFGIKTNLVDFQGRNELEEEHDHHESHHHTHHKKKAGQGLFCCCKQASVNPDELDRIELAFRRIDLNNDGVITWDEFLKNVGDIDPEQAKRIFQTCDNDGDQKITLMEFKAMANSK